MTVDEIRAAIQGGEWVSIAPELRPSQNLVAGKVQPFFLSRVFRYSPDDKFECTVVNFADPGGKVPLVRIHIKGRIVWQGPHPVASGAQKVDYVADEAYEVTPLHPGFADDVNKAPSGGLKRWEVGVTQDVKRKGFPAFGLVEGQVYTDYDLIYIFDNLFFNGSKNVDGRAFDKPENRPTNLQVPLIRRA